MYVWMHRMEIQAGNKGRFCSFHWASTADSDFLDKPTSSRLDLKGFFSFCLGEHTAIPNNIPVVKNKQRKVNLENGTGGAALSWCAAVLASLRLT